MSTRVVKPVRTRCSNYLVDCSVIFGVVDIALSESCCFSLHSLHSYWCSHALDVTRDLNLPFEVSLRVECQ